MEIEVCWVFGDLADIHNMKKVTSTTYTVKVDSIGTAKTVAELLGGSVEFWQFWSIAHAGKRLKADETDPKALKKVRMIAPIGHWSKNSLFFHPVVGLPHLNWKEK
jgi:hypothetical protein